MTQSILTDLKKAAKKSLKAQKDTLANSQAQLEILNGELFSDGVLPYFKNKIAETGQFPLKPKTLEVLQINVGYMCNQVCGHCNVDAGPDPGNHGTVPRGHSKYGCPYPRPYRWRA